MFVIFAIRESHEVVFVSAGVDTKTTSFGEHGRGIRIVCEISKSGRFLHFTVGMTFC